MAYAVMRLHSLLSLVLFFTFLIFDHTTVYMSFLVHNYYTILYYIILFIILLVP